MSFFLEFFNKRQAWIYARKIRRIRDFLFVFSRKFFLCFLCRDLWCSFTLKLHFLTYLKFFFYIDKNDFIIFSLLTYFLALIINNLLQIIFFVLYYLDILYNFEHFSRIYMCEIYLQLWKLYENKFTESAILRHSGYNIQGVHELF